MSRYNNDPLCGACLLAVRDRVGVTPAWLWDSVPLRQALARTDMAAVMAILRGAAGMSQLEFGHILGWSQSVITKIECGRRDTFHDIREILRIADLLDMPRQALLPLVTGCVDPECGTDQDIAFWEDAMDPLRQVGRREFTVMVSGLALAAALPPERADRGHVRYLQASLERLRRQDAAVGGGTLRTQAVRLFARARAMLDESDYTEQVGRELMAVTADLGLVSAWLAYDSGDQASARALYSEAELLAGSAGDSKVLAHVYANMAQQAVHLARSTERRGTAREALRFIDRAADSARYIPSSALHALLALRQALAYSQLGDAAAFRAAIDRARREADRGPHDSDPSWTAFVTHSEIAGYEAMGAVQLNRPGDAVPLYQAVLDDDGRSPRDRAYYRARLAAALCAAGDQREAVAEGLRVVGDLGEGLTSTRVLNELRPVRSGTHELTLDIHQEFCQQFDAAERALAAT
ncbi:helix-turn-helix domain-containing protein [Actinomadura bangladeshensis]|uniref:helix-turn-helix domain-containing protein n=1 Tax=Actinomadura bangladeshensis TaxID=453573 RepID=UPI0014042BA2|nr:helix-turn-helix transcriptional regulator [Actinomadura bangladeshensis]